MYQSIHETVSVIGVYDPQLPTQKGKFRPKKFQWQGKTYVVDQVTLIANVKDGGVRQRIYSIISGSNVYRLLFNRESEEWWLEEIWLE